MDPYLSSTPPQGQMQTQMQPSHAHGSQSSISNLNLESATNRFKRAFGRKKTGRLADEDGTQSDAPSSSRKRGPTGGISSLITKKDPKPTLQFASSTFQVLGQRLNKPTSGTPRVASQIGPPPEFVSPVPPEASKNEQKPGKGPSMGLSSTPGPAALPNAGPVTVSSSVNTRTIHRASQLVTGPEISAAIEYMLDSPRNSAGSPPKSKVSFEAPRPSEPPSPRAQRSGSVGADAAPQPRPGRSSIDAGKRRSMSLSFLPGLSSLGSQSSSSPQVQPTTVERDPAPPPSSYTAPKFLPSSLNSHHRSQSNVHNIPTFLSSSSISEAKPAIEANANGFIMPSHSDRSSSNIRGKLAAWTSTPSNNTRERGNGARGSSPSHSKAASMVASIGPAATAATGIAVSFSRRAYEKVNSMWAVNNRALQSHSAPHSTQTSESDTASHGSQRYPGSMGAHSRARSNYSGGGSMSDAEISRRRLGVHTSNQHSKLDGGSYPNVPRNEGQLGPKLGTMLRPPFRPINQGGGLIFGRPLADCVRDTKALVLLESHSRAKSEDEDTNAEDELAERAVVAVEARYIPALVLRCVQHIEQWGLMEEGIFRISGRTSHINKLRMEFASGADYDLQECGPGDLDPHAVASVLKAFLRELPEPILTRARGPLFEATFERAKEAGFMLAMPSPTSPPPPGGYSAGTRQGGVGGLPPNPRATLPSGPRNGLSSPLVPSQDHQSSQDFLHLQSSPASHPSIPHSPPATPNPTQTFDLTTPEEPTSATPAEALANLLQEFRALVFSLPRENRDLLLTIAELLRKAAAQSKVTKMPLSNLLLVLCPSMSMNPGILKILVEHYSAIFEEEQSSVPGQTSTTIPLPSNTTEILGSDTCTDGTLQGQGPEEVQASVRTPMDAEAQETTEQAVAALPADKLPVRKQSLRRTSQQSRMPIGVDAAPLAYRNVADHPQSERPVESHRPLELAEPVRYAVQLQDVQRREGFSCSTSSRSTSPRPSQEGSRPSAPAGPRPPRTLPAPLTLHAHKSSISSTQSPTPQQGDFPRTPPVVRSASPRVVAFPAGDENKSVPMMPNPTTDLQPSEPDSTSLSGGGVTPVVTPSLPDVENIAPLTSTFVDKRVTHLIQRRTIFASDITPPSSSSTGMGLSPPVLNNGEGISPALDPPISTGTAVTYGSSLGAPTPGSQTSTTSQPLTPLLVAMQSENAGHSGDEGNGDEGEVLYPKVEPLSVQKKAPAPIPGEGSLEPATCGKINQSDHGSASQQTLHLDNPTSIYPESSLSSANSAITDSTNLFDGELSWPEVPTTIPIVKPGATSANPLAPTHMEPSAVQYGESLSLPLVPANSSHSEGQSSSCSADGLDTHGVSTLSPAVVPVVSESQRPPKLYSEELSSKAFDMAMAPKEALLTPLPMSDSPKFDYEEEQSDAPEDMTMREQSNSDSRAPRLTVNSRELLGEDSFWARELKKAIQSPAANSSQEHEHNATRYSGEWAASVLNAAGT